MLMACSVKSGHIEVCGQTAQTGMGAIVAREYLPVFRKCIISLEKTGAVCTLAAASFEPQLTTSQRGPSQVINESQRAEAAIGVTYGRQGEITELQISNSPLD